MVTLSMLGRVGTVHRQSKTFDIISCGLRAPEIRSEFRDQH